MRATYTIPFTDFDYEKLAKECGATCAYQRGDELIVTGTAEAIKTLSANLDFNPDGSSFDDIDEWLDDNRLRTADRIDGYDRDDLGESPDY